MAKKKTYTEKMQNKYGVTSSSFSASASGNSRNDGSYIERMNNIYGSADDNRYHQSASMELINKRVNQRMEEERRKRAEEKARLQNTFAPKYSANSVAAPLNNVNPFQRSIDNGFLPGTKSVSKKTSAPAKVDRNMDPIDNSNKSYNDKYAIISGSRGSDRSSGLSKAVDKLLYGTYKEKPKSATPRGDAVKKYANNSNWGKDVTVGPVAGGMTGRKDIYEYFNDKDADSYISKSFKQGNPISSNAYGFARNNGEGDTASPGWVKQSEWYKNFANANNAEALDTSMEQIRSKLPEFDISKGIELKPETTDSDKEVFRNMTEDEQKEYSYIFGKYGREKATAYLDTIKNKVQYRKAAELYNNWENSGGKYAKALGYAATSGIDAFVRGIGEQAANAFTGSADLSAPAASEIAYQQMRGNYKGLPGVGLDLTQNTAMMAPTMIAGGVGSVLTGGATAASEIASLATTIAPMTFGSAYEEAVNTGADPEHAQLYAALEALNEAGGEYLLGGLENVAGGFTTKWAQGALSKLGKNLPKGTTAATAQALSHFLSTPEGRYIFSMGSEGFEEIVQGTVQNFLKNSMLGQNETLNPFTQDNLYSALIAALSAGTSNMVPYLSARSYGKTVDINAQDLRDNAANVSTSLTDYIGSDGNVDRAAYDDAMAAREQMLQQADYLDQGGRLTNTEKAEAAAANGGRLGIYNEIGTESGLDNEQSYIQMAKRIADADATSENEAVHEASNKAFDNAMELAQKAKDKKEVSNAEKGRAAVEARNIEKAAAIEKMGREILEQAKRAEKAEALETRYAANAGSFKDYARENSAALYSESSNDHMVSAYDGKVGMERYISAYKQAYAAGFNDIESTVLEHLPSMTYLSNEQKLLAYKDGMLDANKYKQRKIEFRQGEAREGGLIKGAELVGSNEQKFLGWVGNKTGLRIEVVEGMKGSANIDLDKGVMRLNPYAENFVSSVSHELTHMIKEFAPKEYDKLQKLTVEALMKSRNADYETLYKSYEDSYRSNVNPDYTVSDILEEITADGATAYLNDAEFAERVANEDRSLAQKIAEFFKGIADTLKQLISEKGVRKVGRVMRENEAQYRMAANTWFDALDKAAGKYKEGYTINSPVFNNLYSVKYQIDENIKEKEIVGFVSKILNGTEKNNSIVIINKLYGELANKISDKVGFDVSGYKMCFNKDEVVHSDKRHGARGKADHSMEDINDYKYLPYIDKVEADVELLRKLSKKYKNSDTTRAKQVLISVSKGDGLYYVVEAVPDITKKEMYVVSVYQTKKAVSQELNTNSPEQNVQNGSVPTAFSKDNISSTKENGNNPQDIGTKSQFPYSPADIENAKEKFQLDEPVEETRNLIAVRNVDQSNLASMLELEGLPSPSIAVTKADIGHTTFGDVTFIFGKDTIDPQYDSRNMVFDADAWTPTYDNVQVDTDIKEDKLYPMYRKLLNYRGKYGRDNMFNDIMLDRANFSDYFRKSSGDIVKLADGSYDLKLLYLDDIGETYGEFPTETKTKPYIDGLSNDKVAELATKLDDIVRNSPPSPSVQRLKYVNANLSEIFKAYKDVTGKALYSENDLAVTKRNKASNVLFGIKQYNNGENTSETIIDTEAAKKDIDAAIDENKYHKWIRDNLGKAIGKKGIRNEKDAYTSNGDLRTFRQLHDSYTAENMLRAMWRGKEQGIAGNAAISTAKNIRGASARKFNNISEMHAASDRLQNVSEGTLFGDKEKALLEDANNRLNAIYSDVARNNGAGMAADASKLLAFDTNYSEAIINAAINAEDSNEVKRSFKNEKLKISDSEALKLINIFKELRELPTDYFEAKPKRVVDWNEIKLAVVPDNIDSELVDQLKDRGINRIEFYPAGDNAARLEAENKATDLRFQLDIDDDPEWNYYTNMVRESSTELKGATDTLGELLSAIDYMPSDKAIERTAKRIKKYTATETSLEDIEKQLKTIFSYISYNNKIDGAKISDIAADYAGELITNSNSAEVDPAAEREYARLKNILKSYTFYVPDTYAGEIETLGGLQKLRREFFGTLNITRDKGISIDTMYQELSELYPDLFSPDIDNPADQLDSIVDRLRATKPKPVVSYANEKDFDAFRYYAGQEIFKAYIAEGAAEAGRKSEYRKLQNEYNKKLKANEKSEKEMAVLQAKAAEMQARYLSELEESRKKVTRQTMRERVYEARKSQKTRYWKDSILKDAKDLSTWMLKPTDKKHVPEALRQPLANFLSQLDLTSRDLAADGEPTQRSLYWMQLKDTWQRIAQNGGIAEGEGSTQYMVIDPDIINKMSELTDKIKGIKKLEELDYIDVLKLSDVMKAMKHSIENANNMISLNRSVDDVAKGTLDHLESLKAKQRHGGILGIRDEVMFNSMLDADTRFHTFGKDAEAVYKAVRKGFNKKVKHTAEAAEWFADIKKELDIKDKDVNAWSKELHDFVASDGSRIKISTAQIMNLYNLLMRTQARDHILQGGITVTSTKANATKVDKLLHRINASENVHVTNEDCLALIGMLTPEQKLFAAKLQKTMSKMADWGNETSMELMGYKKFNERNYWPIKSSRDFITTSLDQAAAGGVVGVAVKNAGPTQSTIKHANNPILIGDAFDVWSDHVNFMANYNAFSIPLTDMIKWYNYVDYGNIRENVDDFKFKGSIKQEISRVFGKGADGYIMRFIEDINGMSNADTSPFKPLISAFKGSAVGANLSVAIQQPTAFFRAMSEIDPKYMIAGLKGTKTSWDTIKKYSAIAQWKDWGFFEIDTGKSMKQITTGVDTVLQSLNEKQMWLAGKGDEVTWKRLWASAEQQVKAEHPKLTFGSDAFYKATAKVFDNIIDKTQVVDSVFTKSDLMRSKSDLDRAMTSFFAEPTKSYNMLYRALFDFRTAKNPYMRAKAGKKFATAIIAFILSNAAAAMAKSIISAMRDKGEDRDKEFWDRWWDHAWEEFWGNVNPAGYFPLIKDIYSVVQGYDATRQDMQAAKDLYYTVTRWQKYFKGDSQYTLLNNIGYSTRLLSDVTGVAIYGAKRDINALIDTVIEFTGNDSLRYEKDRLFYQKENASTVGYYLNMAMRAYKDGNTGLGDKIVQDMIKAGIPEDKIDEKKKEHLAEEEGMQTLIDAKTSGNEVNTDEIRQQLLERGYTDEMIDGKLSGAVTSYIRNNGMSYKDMTGILDNVTDYTASGYKEFNELYSKWAEFEKDVNGWDDKKCRQQFRTACTNYFKPLYKDGNATERSRILNILSRVKASNGDKIYPKEQDIKDWGKE